MPAWNEVENIKKMIDVLFDEIFPSVNAEMHLVVVDNNSTDGMTQLVENEVRRRSKLVMVQQGDKKGLGNAYVVGFKYAMKELQADAVMEMDADGQHPPEFVIPMVEAYLNGAEYAIGSRYIPGGSVPKEWALSRRAISYFGNLFIRIVLTKFNIHDLTTGFRLMKVRGVLDKIDLDNLMELTRFAYKVDLLYQCIKNSQKTVEVPLQFRPRITDKSKFNSQEMVSTFKVALILGIKDKIRLIKFGVVGFTGFLVNFAFIRMFRYFGLTEVLVWIFATEFAIINNYVFNNIWTFKEKKIGGFKQTVYKFLQFNLTSVGALIIQSVVGPIGVKLFGEQYDYLILAFVILVLVLPYNYFMYNVVIWKTWKLPWSKK